MNYSIRPVISMKIFRKCKKEENSESMDYLQDYLITNKEQIYYSEDEDDFSRNKSNHASDAN